MKSHLSLLLFAIQSICEVRCKLIEQQVIIFISKNIDTEKVIAIFQTISHNLTKEGAKSTPITKSVVREVEGWIGIMKAYSSFGKYRYVEIPTSESANCFRLGSFGLTPRPLPLRLPQ